MTNNPSEQIINRSRRKRRILHIGNIANNAYLNAKLLNESGLDCDVLCYDYYHIMGNPEWEDADFLGDVGSDFYPNWGVVNLQGFRRPHWFAQGLLNSCIRYLYSLRKGNYWQAKLGWYQLKIACWIMRYPYLKKYLAKGRWLIRSIVGGVFGSIRRMLRFGYRGIKKLWHIVLALRPAPANEQAVSFNAVKVNNPTSIPAGPSGVKVTMSPNDTSSAPLYQQLALTFSRVFPDRADQLLPGDIVPYLGIIDKLRQLFKQYDVIHAYGTDPILALLSGVRPYLAFEHGTIRGIPFEDTPQGRLTALSYRLADGVIITNCDNKRAADRLQLPNYRFIPHPVNEKWLKPGIGGLALRKSLVSELNADFIIFHPARQHWDAERHPSWEKGNDILIEGMARVIHETGVNLGAIFVEWGQKVAQSKALIARLGIEKNIKWVPPVHSANMARFIDACDLLADQFFLGAFGSTMPRALALGKPAMIYINEEIHRWCFPEMPPIINARTPDQVYQGLKRAFERPDWLADLANQGKGWYKQYHSNAVIRDRLVAYYEDVLANSTENQLEGKK